MFMEFRLFNTLTRAEETIHAMDAEKLRFYCCGPTVYGPAHVGNFRTFVVQDCFRRVVEAVGIPTCHVRNITDVDDKTIRDAQQAGRTLASFTGYWREQFEADCAALNLLAPHVVPSAVEHIPEQIALIKILLEKKLAYQGDDGSVYFRIAAFAPYGKLSGLNLEANRSNADQRLNAADEYEKENAADFALWKAWRTEDGENRWESPWGYGRPGWHIECSAMSMRYLGHSFDLHSGGIDLIFPHHENEIAQSEGATGEPFVRHWFHVAHLRVEDRKMSKSLGNLYTLETIKDWGYQAMDLRYVLLSGHYRQPLNFKRHSLDGARNALQRFKRLAESLPKASPAPIHQRTWGPFNGVIEALCDDLNTARAFGAMHSTAGILEKALKSDGLSADAAQAAADGLANAIETFGFDLQQVVSDGQSADVYAVPAAIISLLEERETARKVKDWAKADSLRDALHAEGWTIEDTPQGPQAKPLSLT
jgi:cysteinyl-tRNA synthetase